MLPVPFRTASLRIKVGVAVIGTFVALSAGESGETELRVGGVVSFVCVALTWRLSIRLLPTAEVAPLKV